MVSQNLTDLAGSKVRVNSLGRSAYLRAPTNSAQTFNFVRKSGWSFVLKLLGTPGISRQNPGLFSPPHTCGRRPPHRRTSGSKSLSLCSFSLPDTRVGFGQSKPRLGDTLMEPFCETGSRQLALNSAIEHQLARDVALRSVLFHAKKHTHTHTHTHSKTQPPLKPGDCAARRRGRQGRQIGQIWDAGEGRQGVYCGPPRCNSAKTQE